MKNTLVYKTPAGEMHCADSLHMLRTLESDSVDLVLTSPPYALHFKKEYGNASQKDYVEWFLPYAAEIKRVIKPSGSFVLNIGGSWQQGAPVRSLYLFRLLLTLCDDVGFDLAQEFFWYNPAKMPAPAEWVNVRRIRVKDSVEYIFWLVKDSFANADNRKVLQPYSPDMKRLINKGVTPTVRPSGHAIRSTFATDHGGAIPGNLIECGNNESNSSYIKESKRLGRKVHPARFPAAIPEFFLNFLTSEGDLVVDPFAGSNTTGSVAESLGRRWLAIEKHLDYAVDSELRFHGSSKSADQPQRQCLLNLGIG